MNAAKTPVTAFRRHAFAQKYSETLDKTQSYREVFGSDQSDATVANQVSKIMQTPEVVATLDEIRAMYVADAPEAYEIEKELMRSKQTPANVRAAIAKEVQARAGLNATIKIEPVLPYQTIILDETQKEEIRKRLDGPTSVEQTNG